MIFNSISFIFFFTSIIFLFYTLPHRFRWVLLLIGSYYFYMAWNPMYIFLITSTSFISWLCALLIERKKEYKKLFLIISLFINLGILFVFKYFNFLNESIKVLFVYCGISYPIKNFDLLLPMGISFYTFQSLSYTIDVYNGKVNIERNYFFFSLYVTFFPQLVAGPIERSDALLPQFREFHDFDYDRVVGGMRRILLGLFKKVVVADTVALYVNTIFNDISKYRGLSVITAAVLFSVQIYCDFSGYSDIALGSAQVLGFKLMENFRQPYLSHSIRVFWKHWHISLSTWFRDYLYIPLGGSRVKPWRKHLNLMITFLLSGLWHGADWTFIIWGGLHGIYQIVEDIGAKFLKKRRKNFKIFIRNGIFYYMKKVLQIIVIFSLITFAYIFFRANNVSDAFTAIRNAFIDPLDLNQLLSDVFSVAESVMPNEIVFRHFFLASIVMGVFIILIIDIIQRFCYEMKKTVGINRPVRWMIYFFASVLIIFFYLLQNGIFGQTSDFIYFQF